MGKSKWLDINSKTGSVRDWYSYQGLPSSSSTSTGPFPLPTGEEAVVY
jgi:hypothetical protein